MAGVGTLGTSLLLETSLVYSQQVCVEYGLYQFVHSPTWERHILDVVMSSLPVCFAQLVLSQRPGSQ